MLQRSSLVAQIPLDPRDSCTLVRQAVRRPSTHVLSERFFKVMFSFSLSPLSLCPDAEYKSLFPFPRRTPFHFHLLSLATLSDSLANLSALASNSAHTGISTVCESSSRLVCRFLICCCCCCCDESVYAICMQCRSFAHLILPINRAFLLLLSLSFQINRICATVLRSIELEQSILKTLCQAITGVSGMCRPGRRASIPFGK